MSALFYNSEQSHAHFPYTLTLIKRKEGSVGVLILSCSSGVNRCVVFEVLSNEGQECVGNIESAHAECEACCMRMIWVIARLRSAVIARFFGSSFYDEAMKEESGAAEPLGM